MTEKNEVIGYYTEDGNIYCIECINKNIEIMKEIDRVITSDDLEEKLYVCNECKEEIREINPKCHLGGKGESGR